MHITDYEKVSELVANNVFLIDGPNGTQNILAKDMGKAILDLTKSSVLFDKLSPYEVPWYEWDKDTDPYGSTIFLNPLSKEYKAYYTRLEDLVYIIPNAAHAWPTLQVLRNSSFHRCKNLGSVFTNEQKAAIQSGLFNDMFVGDYWEIGGYTYRIIGIDNNIYIPKSHIAVLMSYDIYNSNRDIRFGPDPFHSTNDLVNIGYKNASIRTKVHNEIEPIARSAFGQSILTYSAMLQNTNWIESELCSDCTVELLPACGCTTNVTKFSQTIGDTKEPFQFLNSPKTGTYDTLTRNVGLSDAGNDVQVVYNIRNTWIHEIYPTTEAYYYVYFYVG